MKTLSVVTKHIITFVGFVGVVVGSYHGYNYISGLTMNTYRDKSALYGRELKPGERPSWP